MINQYMKIKKQYPDSILFFRLGDFYEMFFEDANIASRVLGITLTSRNKSQKNPIPLCGVPFFSVEPYIAKMLNQGYKVAICEQVEDPKYAKGIVERRVTKVFTPGVIIDTEKLDSKTNNFLACISSYAKSFGLAFCDISTGKFMTSSFSSTDELKGELSSLEPKEILLPDDLIDNKEFSDYFIRNWNPLLTKIESWVWDLESSREVLKEHLSTRSLEPFGLENHPESVIACSVILHYLRETQKDEIPPLDEPRYFELRDYVSIDESTKTNLEILRNIQGSQKSGSLLWVLDETMTAMGGRLLKQWISYPLIDTERIGERLDAVEELKEKSDIRNKLRDSLRQISDIERLIGRISTSSARPRDLGALRDSSIYIKKLKENLNNLNSKLLSEIFNNLDDLNDLREFLQTALVDELPLSIRDEGIIRDGYSNELDALRSIKRDGRKWIAELEARERASTGINSLKIAYNRVFGYFVEVTKSNLRSVPDTYIRKQTLVNAERFITPELRDYEERILGAEERIAELEKRIFEEIRLKISEESYRVRLVSKLIGEIDVLCSLSSVADKYDYRKPEISDSGLIELKEGRHPVIERMDLGEKFVPNDIRIDHEEDQFLIITGPNMAGKSTLIRQVALTVLMAQMGSFVPAKEARIGIVDSIFTRIGASDNLARGQSTFMVEMIETAYILRNATRNSLVILDEIGRGTSTFDGMSIAWAVAEYLHDVGCKVLFATHYHELAQLAVSKKRIKNYNIFVKEELGKVIFLRKLIPGAASHSYGIQVANLAGIPEKVIKMAKGVLHSIEKSQSHIGGSIRGGQLGLFEKDEPIEENKKEAEVLKELREIDPLSINPLEALSKIIELKSKLNNT